MGLLNGFLAGAGGALQQTGLEGVRATLQMQRDELAQQFAASQQEKSFAHADAAQERGFGHSERLQQSGFTHAETLQGQSFKHSEDLQAAGFGNDKVLLEARQAFDKDQHALNRDLTREQIASNEKIHIADRANAMAIAKLGGSVHVDPEGTVSMIGKDGTVKALQGPDGKPLMSAKDLTPAAKAFADVIKDRLKAIDTNQLMAPEEKTTKSAALNTQLLQVLTGGIGAAKDPATTPKVGAPAVGTVVSGMKFKGGDPNKKENWEKAAAAPQTTGLLNSAPGQPGGAAEMMSRIRSGDDAAAERLRQSLL